MEFHNSHQQQWKRESGSLDSGAMLENEKNEERETE